MRTLGVLFVLTRMLLNRVAKLPEKLYEIIENMFNVYAVSCMHDFQTTNH